MTRLGEGFLLMNINKRYINHVDLRMKPLPPSEIHLKGLMPLPLFKQILTRSRCGSELVIVLTRYIPALSHVAEGVYPRCCFHRGRRWF